MIFMYSESLQLILRTCVAEVTISTGHYLEISMSYAFVRNEFVFSLFYDTMNIL